MAPVKKLKILMIIIILLSCIIPLNSSLSEYNQYNINKNSASNNTYIVFLKGLNTKCDGTRFNNMDFYYIRKRLKSAGYRYKDNRFVQYSYNGGQIKNGKWYPNKYTRLDTGQPVEISVKELSGLIQDLSQTHPSARFILIGHSLGGVIAFNFLSKNIDQAKIKGVVTLNAPLTGSIYNVPEPVLNFCRNKISSIWGSTAVRQMILMRRSKEEVLEWRKRVAEKAQKRGIHIATFATHQDLIVLPSSAYLLNQYNEPVADGHIFSVNPFNRLPLSICAHKQILRKKYVADYILNIVKKSI